jgi:hypothetical protein
VEPVLIVAAVATLVGLRLFAIRRIARGQRAFVWLYFAPALIASLVLLWETIILATTQPLASLAVGFVSVVTLIMLGRTLLRWSRKTGMDSSDATSGPFLDYLVWSLLAVPLILGIVLVLLAVGGGLTTSR